MILVTGASGQYGRLVIQHLLKTVAPSDIVAAVRHPKKAADLNELGITVREADYDQPQHWPAALQGVEKVLLVSAPDIGSRVKQHKVVIDAIKESSSVKFVAYTSMLRADTSSVPYADEDRETESMLKEAGVTSVFLRNSWYTENYTMNAGYAVQEGKLYGCAKNGRISGASRTDYAEAAATVLTTSVVLKQVYELAGDSSFTLQDVASEISKQSGKLINYVDLSDEEYESLLVSYQLSKTLAFTLAMADAGAANGDVYSDSHDLSDLIGRNTTPLSVAVASALESGTTIS